MLDRTMTLAGAAPLQVLQIGMEWFTSNSAGGLARYYTDLFKSLPDAGIELTGLVCGSDTVTTLTGGRVHSFAPEDASFPGRLMGARRATERLLREKQFDVVACHFALYGAPALDRLRGRPLVSHFHGPWADESGRQGEGRIVVALKRALEKLVYRRAQRMIVLSRAFRELVVRSYGVPEECLRVVAGSVDVTRFAVPETRRQARVALGWPQDRPILLTVRRLTARMGLDRLLDAMVPIVRSEPDTLLYIAGKGPLAEKLQQQAAALDLQDHVKFLGFLPDHDLPMAYRAANINVVPTDTLEGFGLSAAEALAAGTPSMVTPVGGLPEVVFDLSPDLVFDSSASSDLGRGLLAALRGSIRLPAGEICRAYAASRFDPALCGRRVAAIYREVA